MRSRGPGHDYLLERNKDAMVGVTATDTDDQYYSSGHSFGLTIVLPMEEALSLYGTVTVARVCHQF